MNHSIRHNKIYQVFLCKSDKIYGLIWKKYLLLKIKNIYSTNKLNYFKENFTTLTYS